MKQRIQAIIKNYNIDVTVLSDFISAVVMSEKLHGTNKKEIDIDRFAAEFPDFGFKANTKLSITPLPKVQVMRIFIDSISLYLNKTGVKVQDVHLTMPSSSHIGIGKPVSGVSTYSDEAECEKMLKLLEAASDDMTDCNEIFEAISLRLCYINKLKISEVLFEVADFSKVYLPEEYANYGFNVSTTLPECLKSITKNERARLYENNFAVQFCSNFIRMVYSSTGESPNVSDDDMVTALMTLSNITRLITNDLPIGIDTASSKLSTSWIPNHRNNSNFTIFSKVFSIDKKATIQDVDKLCKLLYKLEEVHNG